MKTVSNRVGLILIGDELLSGQRQDKHMASAITMLKARGMTLAWVRMVADEREMLLSTFHETQQTNEIVFSFGGIGATPDDLTRQCAADAFGLKLCHHPQAVALIERQFGDKAYPQRIRMAELPDGCTLIPNPINNVPGFKVAHHHFVPGFPSMSWPMIEWVLDTHYRHLQSIHPDIEQRWELCNVLESDLIPMMEQLLETFPAVRLSSLPSTERSRVIDFGLKGQPEAVNDAGQWFEHQMQAQAIQCQRQAS